MNGSDRRTDAACPRLAARDSLYTPVHVVELELDDPGELRSPGGQGPTDPDGRVLALVRLHGHPLGLVRASGAPGDRAGLRRALVDAAHRDLAFTPTHTSTTSSPATATPEARPCRAGSARAPADALRVSVIVATHNRAGQLRQCLDSLLRNGYPQLELIVVDNAPSSDEARTLIRERYAGRVRYLREPVAGLARAHNTGLAAAHGEVCAFTDDDTLADPGWVAALAAAFADDQRAGCVTGLILPAELDTPAQVALELHGGFAKGFTPRSWSLREPPADPLFPFAAGQFGSGANMAFRTAALRRLGGFDPAMGTGTPARGGDDLLAFFRVLAAGYTLAYQPEAVIWHRHRRTPEAVPAQAFGYGAGFGAFLAAALAHEPAMLPELLRRLPQGVGHAARRSHRDTGAPVHSGPDLGHLELRGLLYGPLGYLRSRVQAHRVRSHRHGE
ncbi:glycosyltransferase family 2 protein [Kitasatospora mediocidica]|uniref:glycosyltransferase family 2 protein n=1 Tax=Kitasatospora mediocidica TaxID=58352 RepID=UPI0009FBAE63|nr:glycosyltransferase [Kitasatospora mediocidica]